MSWTTPPSRESEPYEALAQLYDFVMRHVNYVDWADYVEALFRHHEPVPRRIIEVACGTGTLAMDLTMRGYVVHGIDRSPAMIARAKAKVGAAGLSPSPTFALGDMRDLPHDDADALLCLYDSINYCLTADDLRATFSSFRRVVRSGALCVFDITTETNSLRYFRAYRCRERWKGYSYRRASTYIPEERLQVNEFYIRRNGAPEALHERHEQRVYALDEVLAAVPRDRWDVLGTYDDFSLARAHEGSERIHVAMRAR